MSIHKEFHFLSADGTSELYARSWSPAKSEPIAILQIVHGISDHSGRYHYLADFFADQGFYVVAEDHLGHGKTARDRDSLGFSAEKDGWKKMTDNVYALHNIVRNEYPSLPYILFGHSMGSFLSRSYLIRYPSTVDACILSGTAQQPAAMLAFGLTACRAEKARLGGHGRSSVLQSLCFGAYNRSFQPNRTKNDWITAVTEEVDKYEADPYCSMIPTTTLMLDMLCGVKFNQDNNNLAKMDMSTPILFIAGEKDPVGNMGKGVKAAYQAFKAIGCKDVSIKLYPNARHELHNESNKEEVFVKLLSWIKQKI